MLKKQPRQAAQKKKLENESKKIRQEKKKTLYKEMKSSLDFISSQETIRKRWMDKALKTANTATMITAKSMMKVLNEKQVELAQLIFMGKKPKSVKCADFVSVFNWRTRFSGHIKYG